MNLDDTIYRGHVRHLDNEDDIKDLSSKYLTYTEETQFEYDYGGTFKPKVAKQKKLPIKAMIPSKLLYQGGPEVASSLD
jgi:hypothetical protein